VVIAAGYRWMLGDLCFEHMAASPAGPFDVISTMGLTKPHLCVYRRPAELVGTIGWMKRIDWRAGDEEVLHYWMRKVAGDVEPKPPRRIGVDPACYDLADHFLAEQVRGDQRVTEGHRTSLAEAIQQAVEDWYGAQNWEPR
jgi:hypothetical protein